MAAEKHGTTPRTRPLVLLAVGVLGLVAIVGSGGGSVDAPECSFFSNTCNPTVGPINLPAPPYAYIQPSRVAVQVGTPITFTVTTANVDSPGLQWRRLSADGASYVDIPGATGATFTLPGANLADNGVRFTVRVTDRNGIVAVPTGVAWVDLLVSPQPGLVLSDDDFADSEWQATAAATPASGAPTHAAQRQPAGGNPGAFRRMVHVMPAGPSELRVVHLAMNLSYAPATQGAVLAIDYREDCTLLENTTSTYRIGTSLWLEQGERRYAIATADCAARVWSSLETSYSLAAADFTLIEGPPCSLGEACPDFSAAGAPLRFGYVRSSSAAAGVGGTLTHGIDNWAVTVWRR